MPIVNGTLTDFGLDPLDVNSPVLLFRASSTGLAGLNVLSARKAVEVVPAANGYFEADLVATTLIAPETTHYTVEIRYRDDQSGMMVTELLPWKLLVPPEGGALGDLLRVPANPGLVWTGTEPPIMASPGTWWLDPATGDLSELGGDGSTWNYKANLRGPAGMNATDAAGDDAAIAAFIAAQGTATSTKLAAATLAAVKRAPAPARHPVGSKIVFMYDDPEDNTPDDDLIALHIAKAVPASWAVTAANIDSANTSTRGHGYYGSAHWHNLVTNHGHELVNHSATHANIRSVSDAVLEYEVNGALDLLEGKGFKVDGFVYPNEDSGAATRRKVSQRHLWAVGNLNGAVGNRVSNPLQTYTIGRRHIGDDPVAALANNKNAITGAVNRGDQILILWTHPYTLTAEGLTAHAELIDFAKASGLPVVTMGEAMRQLHNPYDAGDTYADPVDGLRPWTTVGADGTLRASVLPIVAEASTITAAMTPEQFTLGSVTTAIVATTAGFPGGKSGRVETDRRSTSSLQHRQIFIDTDSRMHIRHAANTTTWLSWVEFESVKSASTAALESVANALNTTGKYLGRRVTNSTTGVQVFAAGSAANAVWKDAMGNTVHTPI